VDGVDRGRGALEWHALARGGRRLPRRAGAPRRDARGCGSRRAGPPAGDRPRAPARSRAAGADAGRAPPRREPRDGDRGLEGHGARDRPGRAVRADRRSDGSARGSHRQRVRDDRAALSAVHAGAGGGRVRPRGARRPAVAGGPRARPHDARGGGRRRDRPAVVLRPRQRGLGEPPADRGPGSGRRRASQARGEGQGGGATWLLEDELMSSVGGAR
jgi:hypothetical protein